MTLDEILTRFAAAKGRPLADTKAAVYLETPDGLAAVRDIRLETEEDSDPTDSIIVIEVEPAAFGGAGQDNY